MGNQHLESFDLAIFRGILLCNEKDELSINDNKIVPVDATKFPGYHLSVFARVHRVIKRRRNQSLQKRSDKDKKGKKPKKSECDTEEGSDGGAVGSSIQETDSKVYRKRKRSSLEKYLSLNSELNL